MIRSTVALASTARVRRRSAYRFHPPIALLLFAVLPGLASGADGHFAFENVIDLARNIAQKSYEAPDKVLPSSMSELSKEQWDAIRYRPEVALWQEGDIPFAVRFHHPGFIYGNMITFHVVEEGRSRLLPFSAELFNYPSAELKEMAANAGLGFAGFILDAPFDAEKGPSEQRGMDEIASFLGASYFHSRGRQSEFGVLARALALDTALPSGEEFPYFRQIWLVKPEAGATALTAYALVDSPRMTGAVLMTIEPGTSIVMDMQARFFPRRGAAFPGKIGLAPLTSMFLYSETDNGRTGDYRPEIHNSDGLLLFANDEWTWRPLANPERLTITCFEMRNPRGFGLLQRDDVFDHYQDLDARYDRRASVWVEPAGDWGEGHVELVEIPGSEDYHGNIVAFWVPAGTPAPADPAGEQGQDGEPPRLTLAYRLYWMTPGVTPHDLGRAVATRIKKTPNSDVVRFLIDFEGERLNSLGADTGLASIVETPEQVPVLERKLLKNGVTGGWRLSLAVRVPTKDGILNSIFSSRNGNGRVRLKALLKQGENISDPLTETWIFDLRL